MKARTTVISTAAAIGACCIVLTGCSSQPAVTEVWRVDAPVMAPPTEIDGVLIAPVSEGDDNYSMQAWDGETGEQLWTAEATAWLDGAIASAWELGAEGSAVAMFMVPGEHGVTWRMVDPRSGDEIAWPTSTDGLDESWEEIVSVWDCEPTSEPRALCFSVPDGDSSRYLRLGPEVALSDIPIVERGDGTIHRLDAGVYQDADSGDIALHSAGQRVWSVPFSAVFDRDPFEGETPDAVAFNEETILLQSNETYYDDDDSWDTAASTLVALDLTSGEVLWSRDSLRMVQVTWSDDYAIAFDDRRGVFTPDDDGVGQPTDVEYDIVRVDLETGETLWSVPWNQAMFDETDHEANFSGSSTSGLLLQSDEGAVLIDPDSGAAEPVSDGVALPCVSQEPLERAWSPAGEDVTLTQQGVKTWCSPQHEPIDEPVLDPTIVSIVGVGVGDDIRVVLEDAGLVAYRGSE